MEATGFGHIPTNKINEIKELINSGIPIVIASQTLWGRVNLNVYETGRKLAQIGVIGNYCDWLPETAFTKLMWVLGHTKNMDKIRKMMLTNYAGEITDRSKPEIFLY
jgi:glutamyl-tRNA(Gln) amidotransferase subunit D